MNLRIRTVLPLIISALALLLVVSAGLTAYDAIGRRQDSQAFLKVNQISQLLLHGAGQWAIERGMTNASLKSADVLSPERRAEIVKLRASADQAFRDAVQRLVAIPAMKAGEKDIADAERIFREFEAFRAKVDENLARPGAERTPEIVQGFFRFAFYVGSGKAEKFEIACLKDKSEGFGKRRVRHSLQQRVVHVVQ